MNNYSDFQKQIALTYVQARFSSFLETSKETDIDKINKDNT